MNISIRGDKIEVTDSIKNYVKEKLARLDKYFEDANKIDAHILIRVRNGEQIIEVTIPTSRYTLRAEEATSDLYAAIDMVVDVLERQIRKNKTKLKRYKTNETIEFVFTEDETEPDVEENKIVKRKNITSKPMGEEEAVLQMDLLGHDFFVFKNIDEDCVSVLYRRKDGNFGIINSK